MEKLLLMGHAGSIPARRIGIMPLDENRPTRRRIKGPTTDHKIVADTEYKSR
ncbi:hypothetical protein [Hyphomicrobium sp. D-2]|uniref:hypothetical protein n=1 Tax=Hyphomicrobium sp. D-2 TaxID=3041621 RepID=UPI002456A09A|nr:hypothetical protein [Hyphomicrobium sp. D-2]MDH4983654.1 hypothetical protein [Hyphomicrobium sp. D-2]